MKEENQKNNSRQAKVVHVLKLVGQHVILIIETAFASDLVAQFY